MQVQVVGAGGLHVVGTERHESRRIDNQVLVITLLTCLIVQLNHVL